MMITSYEDVMGENDLHSEEEEEEEEGDVVTPIEEAAEVMEPPPKRQKTVWEIHGLDTRNYETEQLGEVSKDRSRCFGCIHVGEQDKTTLRYDQINNMINVIRKSVARCDPVALARHVAELHDAIRREHNSNLINGTRPMCVWDAAMVLDHIRNHNTDPEMQTWLRLMEIQEMIQISLRASVEIDPDTGEKRINPQQYKVYESLVKLHAQVSKMDATKCMFRGNEKQMDMSAAREEIISTGTKDIVDYFRKPGGQ